MIEESPLINKQADQSSPFIPAANAISEQAKPILPRSRSVSKSPPGGQLLNRQEKRENKRRIETAHSPLQKSATKKKALRN